MTALRQRMIEDMRLHGYTESTKETYLGAVARLAAHYKKSPAQIGEEELRLYILYLMEVRQLSSAFHEADSGGHQVPVRGDPSPHVADAHPGTLPLLEEGARGSQQG